MASSDWTVCTGSLSSPSVDRGVTNGIARPPGGGSFLYGFNSLEVVTGAVALFTNQTNFAPSAKGGRISGAIQRGVSGGNIGFAPFIFLGLQGPNASDTGYLLGLSDEDPSKITLRKGALDVGLPDAAVGEVGILDKGTDTHAVGDWVHLLLDMIVNDNGDVLLQARQNDLSTNDVDDPTWEAIPGLADFVDDTLGINSGSPPYLTSRFGWGFQVSDVTRRGFFDHIEVLRQL